MKTFVLFLVALLNIRHISSITEDYYWREYMGNIPDDAFIGGQNNDGHKVYIGQAYVPHEGLVVVQIFPETKEVTAPGSSGGVYTVSEYIKILCARNHEKFRWEKATASALHLEMIGKKPIIGGRERGGILYIGRISVEGNIKIGKVASFNAGNAAFHFVFNGRQKESATYEILLTGDSSENVTRTAKVY